jgi:OOP family OmpA-OmpF porin
MRFSLRAMFMISALTLLALPAFAEDGFYLGGSVGQAEINTGTLADVKFEGDDTGYKVFGGYRFLKFFAVEGAYADLGSVQNKAAVNRKTADMNAYTAEGIGFIPLGIADIFGKAGFASWNADFSSDGGTLPIPSSADGTDLVYGAGVQFRFKSIAVRGEVEYYDVEESDDVYQYSVGASWTF